jgi:xanthine dehydrogenase/oxidase
MAVTTTEGIGSTRTLLDPVQDRVAAENGSQCGFCTPGFVMNMHALLRAHHHLSEQEIEDRFSGNICRCTGYRPILRAMRSFADEVDVMPPANTPAVIRGANAATGSPGSTATASSTAAATPSVPVLERPENRRPFRPAAAVVKARHFDDDRERSQLHAWSVSPRRLHFTAGGYEWFRPATLDEVYALKIRYAAQPGDVKLVAGNTSVGIYTDEDPHVLIDISGIAELGRIGMSADGSVLDIGATVRIESLITCLQGLISELPAGRSAGLVALLAHLKRIGSTQVRSMASVAGNLMLVWNHIGSGTPFPSDLATVLTALGASVRVGSRSYADGFCDFSIHDFFTQSMLPADFVILGMSVPLSLQREYVETFKVARRVQNAHAIVNAGFSVRLDTENRVVAGSAILAFGGIGRSPIRAFTTERLLDGRPWSEELLGGALPVLEAEIRAALVPFADGIPAEYRVSLATTLFYKFFVGVALQVAPAEVGVRNRSAGVPYVRPLSYGQQHYEVYPSEFPVSEPLVKLSAFSQATGEAVYTHDLPVPPGTLHGAYVQSTRAHAAFTVQPITAEAEPLLYDFITAADVPVAANNATGLGRDDYVFAPGTVVYVGQPIGLVLAETKHAALEIAARIEANHVTYEEQAPIFGIPAAIAANSIYQDNPPVASYLEHIDHIERPGSDQNWLANPVVPPPGCQVVTGVQATGAQMHFYMETFSAIAIPEEGRSLTLYCSTQDAGSAQASAAQALGIPVSHVTVHVPLVGGGYGAKETRPPLVATAAAVGAWKTGRPVRLVLERRADSLTVGRRHPYLGQYYAAFAPDGTISATKTTFWSDGGSSYDVSFPVMDLTQLSADNAYMTPTYRTDGNVCRTNIASSTAFRSFGVIQGTLIQEAAIERVAHALRMLPEDVRLKNMYRNGSETEFDTTPYGQELKDCTLRNVWAQIMASSDFVAREQAVREFNTANRWRKRGISAIPLKYGIAYTAKVLDQANALVTAFSADGSVLVQHGGIELGQGLHTKIVQIAAERLGVPVANVRIGATQTSAVANASSTGGSTAADLNGGAVADACATLRTRLTDFLVHKGAAWCQQNGVGDWQTNWSACWSKIVLLAYLDRTDLTAHGFYRSPGLVDVTNAQPIGHPFFYFNYCAAVSEVEIDVATGEFDIRRADVLYDAGKSLNPALDIGQVEGGFVQGIGNLTTEEVLYDAAGTLISFGTWDYKPPCSKTIPVDFRVTLLSSPRRALRTGEPLDPAGIQSSKTTGEPPLVLASTVFFAIRHAIAAARLDSGLDDWFDLEAPATVARIQAACAVTPAQLRL